MSGADWHTDFEVATRFFRRRWFDEVQDLLEASRGEALAFDDLDLDSDLMELGTAVSTDRLRQLALRGLGDDERVLQTIEAEPALARAFLRLMAVNLAFHLRTDDLLLALVASAENGPPPRLAPSDLGGLLVRARSARRARELVVSLPFSRREPALAAIEPSFVPGTWSVLHARATTAELGEAVERILARRKLVSVPWAKAPGGERFVATRRRGGWTTLVSSRGVDRELAQEVSSILAPVAWAERTDDAARFTLFERQRAVDEQTGLDEVSGALRALGVTAHDLKAPGKHVSLEFEDYARPGENSPARLRKLNALGLAFLPPDEARKAKAR
jgi:hypothetical protein